MFSVIFNIEMFAALVCLFAVSLVLLEMLDT